MEKLNVTFCSFPDYSSNARPLFEYMQEKYEDLMNIRWAVNSEEMEEKLNSQGIKAYRIGTKEYFDEIRKTDVFFTTHCNIIGEKKEDAMYIELWHGISPKQIGFMSDHMLENDLKWYSDIKGKVDYFVVPSDFWRVIFSTRFNVEYSRTISLGYPKLNDFINKDSKAILSKVIDKDVSKYDKIIYYMPTFRKGCDREQESKVNLDNVFNIQSYTEEELVKYLEEHNYLLCVKKHPSEELEFKEIDSENVVLIQEKSLAGNGLTVNDILNAADLMVTDYSSLGIEFIFLDKPVVYLTNDLEEYGKNRGFTFGDITFWMAGHKVTNITELIKAFDGSLKEDFDYKEEFKQKRNLWFSDLKDGGCERICDYFFKPDGTLKIGKENRPKTSEDALRERIDELKNTVNEKNDVIAQREARIKELDDFIAQIINSKGWQFLEKVRSLGKPFRKK